MNYYERHLGDYAKSTAHLTMLEHGAYCLLLDRYYSTERGLPKDAVHRVARAKSKAEIHAVDAVLSEFFILVDNVYINQRAEDELEKARGRIRAAQENGRRGGRPKKNPAGNENQSAGFLIGYGNETQTKAHHTPESIIQIPNTK